MGDMPAIPFEEVRSRFQGLPDKWANHVGLTKREMMAMHALQGLLAAPDLNTVEPDAVAGTAIAYVDALLAELDRTSK